MISPFRGMAGLVVALLILGGGTAFGQKQTPGQITQFDPSLNVVDSVITQDPSGNIGIGTATPAAALDVASGDLNLSGNLLKGGQLFLHNFGPQNTFVGINAGNQTMTGFGFNTGIGTHALFSNTTGDSNTACGVQALLNNTSGGGNTATGFQALASNINGSSNTASGREALRLNTTGSWNTANGFEALTGNTAGFENTATGFASLYFNTSGTGNTSVGAFALLHNVTGSDNTAVGYNAGPGPELGDLHNTTAIGSLAVVDASNKIRLGNGGVTVIEGQVPYTFTSDKNQKEKFQPVDGDEVLRKVGALSLTSWNYIGHDPQQFRHYGPVAQEFFAAFGHDGVGTVGTPTTINSGDMEGILMIAVQALEKQNAALRTRIEALERLVIDRTATVR